MNKNITLKIPLVLLMVLVIGGFQNYNAFGYDEPVDPVEPFLPNAASIIYLPYVGNNSSGGSPDDWLIVDHRAVDQFEQIPENYLTAARNLRLLFSDRSVGENINIALNCLAAPSWAESAPGCRRDYYGASWDWKSYTVEDLNNGLVPSRILFTPDPVRYNRSNWTFEFKMGTWYDLTEDFIEVLAPAYLNSKDVLTYQFSYLNVAPDSDIADPKVGFFADNPNRADIHDLEAFMAQHPDKTFFLWTTSLSRSYGSEVANAFNTLMRQYAREHNIILFDVADIESRTDYGTTCFDNRDGILYCDHAGNCENFPDDGLNTPAICQDYTTEINGGHLGTVSAGKIRIAKAYWVLMARIAGWRP
jgi:hypothetical protein